LEVVLGLLVLTDQLSYSGYWVLDLDHCAAWVGLGLYLIDGPWVFEPDHLDVGRGCHGAVFGENMAVTADLVLLTSSLWWSQ